MIINRFYGKKGFKINGAVYTATVANGHTIQAGDFVRISGDADKTAYQYYSSTVASLGVAKTGGSGGATISVYMPV